MAKKLMEYHPSLTIDEFKPGSFCVFNRNIEIKGKDVERVYSNNVYSDNKAQKNNIDWYVGAKEEKGGFAIDIDEEVKGGFAIDKPEREAPGGFAIDTGDDKVTGGFAIDKGDADRGEFKDYQNKRKKVASYMAEPGFVIGVNKVSGKIYVMFEDDFVENTCHIFVAPTAEAYSFDIMDEYIQSDRRAS